MQGRWDDAHVPIARDGSNSWCLRPARFVSSRRLILCRLSPKFAAGVTQAWRRYTTLFWSAHDVVLKTSRNKSAWQDATAIPLGSFPLSPIVFYTSSERDMIRRLSVLGIMHRSKKTFNLFDECNSKIQIRDFIFVSVCYIFFFSFKVYC